VVRRVCHSFPAERLDRSCGGAYIVLMSMISLSFESSTPQRPPQVRGALRWSETPLPLCERMGCHGNRVAPHALG
jgi:hypothetical protein